MAEEISDDKANSKSPPATRRARVGRKDPLGPDSEIGWRLRELYAAVENEPLPMELIDLLEKLSQAEAKATK